MSSTNGEIHGWWKSLLDITWWPEQTDQALWQRSDNMILGSYAWMLFYDITCGLYVEYHFMGKRLRSIHIRNLIQIFMKETLRPGCTFFHKSIRICLNPELKLLNKYYFVRVFICLLFNYYNFTTAGIYRRNAVGNLILYL